MKKKIETTLRTIPIIYIILSLVNNRRISRVLKILESQIILRLASGSEGNGIPPCFNDFVRNRHWSWPFEKSIFRSEKRRRKRKGKSSKCRVTSEKSGVTILRCYRHVSIEGTGGGGNIRIDPIDISPRHNSIEYRMNASSPAGPRRFTPPQ